MTVRGLDHIYEVYAFIYHHDVVWVNELVVIGYLLHYVRFQEWCTGTIYSLIKL